MQRWQSRLSVISQAGAGAKSPISMIRSFTKNKSNYCNNSRVPWTSEEKESDMTMLVKSRIIAAKTLQTEWDTEVISYHFQCSISVVQAPPCHQHGVAVSGQASMDPDDKVPKIPFFQTETSVSVKVHFIQYIFSYISHEKNIFHQRPDSPTLVLLGKTIGQALLVDASSPLPPQERQCICT